VEIMKKLLLGLACGVCLTVGTQAFASSTINSIIFPVKYIINDTEKALGTDYETLNYKGHVYVPIRFIAENIGATVAYEADSSSVFVKNNGTLVLKDPNVSYISISNLVLTDDGNKTTVNGLLNMDDGGNGFVGANLSFYNVKGDKIGEVAISQNFNPGINHFEINGDGNFKNYNTVKLTVGATGGGIINKNP
jgi:hypothetical protein